MSTNYKLVFDEIVRNHYKEIFHYVHKQTSNTEDAKDLTQEIFMKVFEKFHTYNPKKASIRTWLYRIAHNHVVNHFRNAYQRYKLDLDDTFLDYILDYDDPLQELMNSEDIKYVMIVMNKILNPKHLKLMNLYFFSDLSVDDIAKTLSSPIKSVYNTINTSIQKIKTEMEETLNG